MHRSGLYACGTLRSNRKGFPEDLKPFLKGKQQKLGESVVRQNGNSTVCVWQDNKPVTILATNSDPTKEETVKRKNKDGTTREVPCPQATRLYNMFMGGVDLSDQLRGYYHLYTPEESEILQIYCMVSNQPRHHKCIHTVQELHSPPYHLHESIPC